MIGRVFWRAAALVGFLIPGTQPNAGILLQADWQGVLIQAEVGVDFNFVRLEIDDQAYLLDSEAGLLHELGAVGSGPDLVLSGISHPVLDGVSYGRSVLPYQLGIWSNGPPIAGHRSRYNVLQVDELVCGEVLNSGWMIPFMAGITEALAAAQQLDPRLAPVDRGACGAASFQTYAKNGWPLVIGWRDHEIFRTLKLRFDHRPDAARVSLPKPNQ